MKIMKKIWKNYQHFFIRMLNVLIIITACAVYHNIASVRAEKEMAIQSENNQGEAWNDGTYEGSGQGFGGEIIVNVTIKKGAISNIQIKEAKSEDAAYLDNAKKIISVMIKQQTADVDVASGATYSSKGIISAVENALKEAVK